MIKLIASDIDGTLVKDGSHELNEEYFEVIRRLMDRGITFCAASGRHFSGMYDLFGPLRDEIYYISTSGSTVRTAKQLMKTWSIPKGSYRPLIEDLRAMPDVDIMVDAVDVVYVESGEESTLCRFIRDGYHFSVRNVRDLTEIPEEEVMKVSLYSDIDVEQSCASFLHSHWMDELSVAVSGKMWIDAISPEADKGRALRLLQEHLGVTREETMFFGDNLNDLSAFEAAGTAVTVSNARDEVRERADIVQRSYRHHGVLLELKKLLEEVEHDEAEA